MKRTITMMVLLITITLHALGMLHGLGYGRIYQADNVLPSALQEIDKEAFAGTAIQTITLPDGVLSVGDNVFVDNAFLTDIFIPASVEDISDSAFPKDSDFIIRGIERSFVGDWAKKHNIPFVADDKWKLVLNNQETIGSSREELCSQYCVMNPEKIARGFHVVEEDNLSRRPQDRSELNPIDYRFP